MSISHLFGRTADTTSSVPSTLSQHESTALDHVISCFQDDRDPTRVTLQTVRQGRHPRSEALEEARCITDGVKSSLLDAHQPVEEKSFDTVCNTLALMASRQHPSQRDWPKINHYKISQEESDAIDTLCEQSRYLSHTTSMITSKCHYLQNLKRGIVDEQKKDQPEGTVKTTRFDREDKRRMRQYGHQQTGYSFDKELKLVQGVMDRIKIIQATAGDNPAHTSTILRPWPDQYQITGDREAAQSSALQEDFDRWLNRTNPSLF